MSSRAHLHQLVDELPEGEVGAAERFLEYLSVVRDPFLRTLAAAPLDDESDDDVEADADEGRVAMKRGETVADEELRQQLGI